MYLYFTKLKLCFRTKFLSWFFFCFFLYFFCHFYFISITFCKIFVLKYFFTKRCAYHTVTSLVAFKLGIPFTYFLTKMRGTIIIPKVTFSELYTRTMRHKGCPVKNLGTQRLYILIPTWHCTPYHTGKKRKITLSLGHWLTSM